MLKLIFSVCEYDYTRFLHQIMFKKIQPEVQCSQFNVRISKLKVKHHACSKLLITMLLLFSRMATTKASLAELNFKFVYLYLLTSSLKSLIFSQLLAALHTVDFVVCKRAHFILFERFKRGKKY